MQIIVQITGMMLCESSSFFFLPINVKGLLLLFRMAIFIPTNGVVKRVLIFLRFFSV